MTDMTARTPLQALRQPTTGALLVRLSGTAPWRWFAAVLASFIDMIDPTIARLTHRKRLVVIELDNGSFAFHKVSGSRATPIGSAGAPDEALRKKLSAFRFEEVELRLPAGKVITSTLKIPVAALKFADQVVTSRLDRLTPWRPDAILYGFSISPTPGSDGQRALDFAATSKQIADAAIERMEAFGLAPSAIGATTAPIGQRLPVDLFRGGRENGSKRRRRWIGFMTIASLVVSAFACATSLFYVMESSQKIADVERRLVKARSRLVNATSSSSGRQGDFALIAAKVPDHARFTLISRLAATIPDNTYLDELDLKGDTVRIAGTSVDAFGLLKLIEADPAFSETKFAAPVTRREDGRDGFDLSTTIGDAKPQEPGE